jgi:type I restriction enzyme S subunit
VGVIPENWEIQTGEQLTILISKGSSPRWQGFEYTNTGMLFVTSENVRDGFLDIREPKYLPLEFHEKLKRTKLRKHDILINLVGASIGRSCLIPHALGEANVNQAVGVFRVREEFCARYVAHCFQAPTTVERILEMQVDAARPNISLGDLRRFLIPLPPKAEQEAIAATLSDADALLESLEQLISKKGDLKQAAMQQLLTGQKRLPNFNKEWDTPVLGDLFTFKNGLNKAKAFFGYGTPIVNYMDVYRKRGITACDLQGRVSLSKEELKAFEVRKGDVFFTRTSETADEVGITAVMLDQPHDTVFSGFVLRARPKNDSLDDQFKKYCFSTDAVRKQITSQSTETTRALTNGRYLSAVSILRPPKPEQAAIAAVLSDMDAEIATLERRRDKTRALKQGMMQELLTGKTRLV